MGIGFKELLIILVIVLVLFGAKRLKTIGSDLGGAIKGFRKAVREGDEEGGADAEQKQSTAPSGRVIEGEITAKEKDKV